MKKRKTVILVASILGAIVLTVGVYTVVWFNYVSRNLNSFIEIMDASNFELREPFETYGLRQIYPNLVYDDGSKYWVQILRPRLWDFDGRVLVGTRTNFLYHPEFGIVGAERDYSVGLHLLLGNNILGLELGEIIGANRQDRVMASVDANGNFISADGLSDELIATWKDRRERFSDEIADVFALAHYLFGEDVFAGVGVD